MKKTQKKIYFKLFLLLILLGPIINISAESTEKKAVIQEIETIIDGVTQRKFLLQRMGIEEGQEFISPQLLIDYVDENIQDLKNMRVFEHVRYSLEEIGDHGAGIANYVLYIDIKDANNTFFVPLAGYGSSSGFKIALKSNFYNAFGTLVDFKIESSMNINRNEALNSIDIPKWHITPSISGMKLWGLDFSLSLSQRKATKIIPVTNFSDIIEQQFTNHSTSLILGSSIALPMNFSYTFGPSLSFYYGKQTIVNTAPIDITVADLSWTHSLEYKKVNWIDNFRNGFSAHISNKLIASYNTDNKPLFTTSITSGLSYFWRINRLLNLSGRLNGTWSNNMIELDSYLRGVREGNFNGYLGVAMSIDLTISLIDLDGILEIQARPFFDIGILDQRNQSFNMSEDLAYTTGFDGILYLDKWKSLIIRGTFGINLNHYEWNDPDKYDIIMTAGLSY